MKVFKTVDVPAKTTTHEVGQTCDLCGAKSSERFGSWCTKPYEVNETEVTVTVKQREGYSCPDGGGGTQHEIDLCPDCFKGKLIPWLKSQGANVNEKEWDW